MVAILLHSWGLLSEKWVETKHSSTSYRLTLHCTMFIFFIIYDVICSAHKVTYCDAYQTSLVYFSSLTYQLYVSGQQKCFGILQQKCVNTLPPPP